MDETVRMTFAQALVKGHPEVEMKQCVFASSPGGPADIAADQYPFLQSF